MADAVSSSPRGSMRNIAAKRGHILTAAATQLAKEGYDGMTLKQVSKASGAAVGSIVHFFKDKAGLVAAVADHLASELAADAGKALHAAHGQDVAAAVGALLSAAAQWSKKFPDHQRLLSVIAAFTPPSAQGGMQRRLEQLLAGWAEPLIQMGAIAPLSSIQLYAVVLAPAICASGSTREKRPDASIEWVQVLTAAALAGLSPATASKSGPPHGAAAKTRRGKEQLALSV
jgi:AcrR family transcriptional regulator